MAHYTTGLPKLDLEPFDPTPLYAAARAPRRDEDEPGRQRSRGPCALVGAVTSLLAAAGGALYYYL
jgi:hypothetical protein